MKQVRRSSLLGMYLCRTRILEVPPWCCLDQAIRESQQTYRLRGCNMGCAIVLIDRLVWLWHSRTGEVTPTTTAQESSQPTINDRQECSRRPVIQTHNQAGREEKLLNQYPKRRNPRSGNGGYIQQDWQTHEREGRRSQLGIDLIMAVGGPSSSGARVYRGAAIRSDNCLPPGLTGCRSKEESSLIQSLGLRCCGSRVSVRVPTGVIHLLPSGLRQLLVSLPNSDHQ